MSKYQALIDALEAVTSTNWEHDGGADVFEVDVGVLVASTMETEDAAYIAEANPATIRALLADLERAEKDAERYRELKKRFRVMSLDMGGNHTWVLASSGWLKGPSMDDAVDALAQMAGGG